MNLNLEAAAKGTIKITLRIILVALFIILIYSLIEYCIILVAAIIKHPITLSFASIDTSATFLELVLPLLSGVLILVIVLEMIESILEYIKFDRSSYVYIITEIALIALIRHLITLDMHKIEALEVMAIGFMTLVVTAFYIALRVMKKKEI